jgi:hypothetical protein
MGQDVGADAMLVHVAAVYALDGIRFLTAAPSAQELLERLAMHVKQNADVLLWPEDAANVLCLLEQGEQHAAVDLYFARVGQRWEREVLRTEVVEC